MRLRIKSLQPLNVIANSNKLKNALLIDRIAANNGLVPALLIECQHVAVLSVIR